MQDPNLVEKPDFTSAAYDAVCWALATAKQITREAVATCLTDAWDVDNNAKIAAWEQLREDQEAEAEATLTQEAADLLALEEHRKEEEAEKKEKEKKKLKLKGLAMNKPV